VKSATRLVAPLGLGTVLCILVGAMLLASYGRWVEPARPGVVFPEGFYGYWDQGQYLRETRLLAEGRLPADENEYTYGLGYPVLAVPFYLLGFEGDPFAPVDVIAFGLVVAGTAIVGARLLSRRAGLVAALLVATATPVLGLMTAPWNTTAVTAAFVVTLVVVTSECRATVPGGVIVGLSCGLAFAARYVDVLAFLAVAAWWVLMQPRRHLVRTAVAIAAPAMLILSLVLYTHHHAFGSVTTTPFAFHFQPDGTSDQSLRQYDLRRVPRHAWEVAVTGTAEGQRGPRDPLLRISPFLALAPLGAIALVRRQRWRSLTSTMLFASAFMTTLYLAHPGGGGASLAFDNLRYWVMWYPFWTILSLAGAVVIWRALRGERRAAREAPETPATTGGAR
jgi:disulfide bond formation protein DsbB